MYKTYTIKAKMSGTGSIYDIASATHDRIIKFGTGCRYAVILSAYYGGKGYTTHRTHKSVIATIKKLHSLNYNYEIIDYEGNHYILYKDCFGDTLVRI